MSDLYTLSNRVVVCFLKYKFKFYFTSKSRHSRSQLRFSISYILIWIVNKNKKFIPNFISFEMRSRIWKVKLVLVNTKPTYYRVVR